MNYKKQKIELLSPAGSFECAKKAISAGCDAIYMGGKNYGARAYCQSTKEDNIFDTIDLCKKNNVKFYLTINTLIKSIEIKDLILYVAQFVEKNIDGFIVQDLGVATILKKEFKDIVLNASTQMTCSSIYSIKMLEELGFKKVILVRELSLDEIKEIRKNTNIELECFIHGSMCYCYSGCCLMSSFIGGQSGNRGRCKGPCRLEYNNKKNYEYILSMKDMCCLKDIKNLIMVGIDSLKIEGRMRKPEYVYTVTKIYRKYIDKFYENVGKIEEYDKFCKINIENDINALNNAYNKGGFTNYLYKHNSKDMIWRIK